MATIGELTGLKKSASTATADVLMSTLNPLNVTRFGRWAELAGLLNSSTKDEVGREAIARESNVSGLKPSVAPYRLASRERGVAEESRAAGGKHPYLNLMAERLSPRAMTALGGLAGLAYTLAGDQYTPSDALRNALIGVSLATAPHLIGSAIAGLTPRRSMEEQAARESAGRAMLKLLVPGVAGYDRFKRIGRSRDWDDKIKEQRRQSVTKATAN